MEISLRSQIHYFTTALRSIWVDISHLRSSCSAVYLDHCNFIPDAQIAGSPKERREFSRICLVEHAFEFYGPDALE